MSLFVLDTAGDQQLHNGTKSTPITNKKKKKLLDGKTTTKTLKPNVADSYKDDHQHDEDDYFGLPPPDVDLSSLISETLAKTELKRDKIEQSLKDVTDKVDTTLETVEKSKLKRRRRIYDLDHSDFNNETGKFDDEQLLNVNLSKELAQSKLKPGFEQMKVEPILGFRKRRKINKIERAKTKGGEWYNIPATEKTEEVKNELKILQMRAALDPKHFYKKNDLKVLPKYFQIGTVLPSPLDYYNERDTRKSKKRSLVDELLADEHFQAYNKRKFNEITARKSKYAQRKATKKMKKLKKKK